MTREEAIVILRMVKAYVLPPEYKEALNMAIEALSQPERVRCKDCKYYTESSEACGLFDTRLQFFVLGKKWTEDSFCYWAEVM